jgi:hypothetical protein
MNTTTYKAPWGKMLRWMSAFSVVLVMGIFITIWVLDQSSASRAALLLLPGLLVGAALFIIRDYTIEPQELLIRRLLWTTRLPLAGLQSAVFQPGAMRGSLRLCGNGGMFSFTGWYRSRALGNYRAFVTDLTQTVVLRFPKRTVVVSPENPERFVSEISRFTTRTS